MKERTCDLTYAYPFAGLDFKGHVMQDPWPILIFP